ncbi:MAG: 2-dehydropantoate 2-reductase N-terminal domain-containing protein [Frankiaceae bacterium]
MIFIVGSGVVGTATGKAMLRLGSDVTFVDVDDRRLDALTAEGLNAVPPEEMDLTGATAVFVSVPTPSQDGGGVDLSFVDVACKSIGAALREVSPHDFPLVVFRSTMPPGTTRFRLIPQLEEVSGRRAGTDFGVCYNPEYLREDTAIEDFLAPRCVTIGCGDEESFERLRRIYRGFVLVPVVACDYEAAEFQKYVHNLYNAAKISFFNEMRLVAAKLGIDPDLPFAITAVTAEGIWNPRYGTVDKGPYGGNCLPKDAAAWLSFAAELGLPSVMMSATHRVNATLGPDGAEMAHPRKTLPAMPAFQRVRVGE